jgi:hypothetical protein
VVAASGGSEGTTAPTHGAQPGRRRGPGGLGSGQRAIEPWGASATVTRCRVDHPAGSAGSQRRAG